MIGIYFIKNKANNKIYIGLSTSIEKRFLFHKRRLISGKHKNKHFQSSFDTYGLENFEFSILEECNEDILSEREKYWIVFYKSHDREFGYNKTYGGEFGRLSDEIVQRTAAKLRLRKQPQEMKDRISKTLTGRKRPDRNKFTNDIEKQIIDDFNNKIGIKPLSRKYDCSTCAIYNALERNGIKWKKEKSLFFSEEPVQVLHGEKN